VVKTQVEMDTDAATAKLDAINNYLHATNGSRATAYIDLITNRSTNDVAASGSGSGGRANGSLAGGMATGGIVPQYFAAGGFPGGPRGTDTVPTWLTPGEAVLNVNAVKSLGPANVMHANHTGQWPQQPAQQQPQQMVMTGTLVMDSGEVMGKFRGIAQAEASNAISSANRDARYRRAGVPA
jgi:hypothetical protein